MMITLQDTPKRLRYVPKAGTVTNTRFSYLSSDPSAVKSKGDKSVKGGFVKEGLVKATEKPRRTNGEIIAINRKRVESIQKRKDDTGKMVDSFVKESDSIGFFRRTNATYVPNPGPQMLREARLRPPCEENSGGCLNGNREGNWTNLGVHTSR